VKTFDVAPSVPFRSVGVREPARIEVTFDLVHLRVIRCLQKEKHEHDLPHLRADALIIPDPTLVTQFDGLARVFTRFEGRFDKRTTIYLPGILSAEDVGTREKRHEKRDNDD
jgi:hypothetical protein